VSLREEVLELFAEAQQLGRLVPWRAGVEYGRVVSRSPRHVRVRRPTVRTRRRASAQPKPAVESVGVTRAVCGRCGGYVERRTGYPRSIHLGGGCPAGGVSR
jgi:hypothetical protein